MAQDELIHVQKQKAEGCTKQQGQIEVPVLSVWSREELPKICTRVLQITLKGQSLQIFPHFFVTHGLQVESGHYKTTNKVKIQDQKTAQPIKAHATKPDHLSLIPFLTWWKEITHFLGLFSDFPMHA